MSMLREAEAASTVIKLSIASADRESPKRAKVWCVTSSKDCLDLKACTQLRKAQTANCAVKSSALTSGIAISSLRQSSACSCAVG
jgi:hypothetical protein